MRAPQLLGRIEIHPEVVLGKPVIRGTRITVEILREKLAAGANTEEVLADYPALERDDGLAARVNWKAAGNSFGDCGSRRSNPQNP